MIIVDKNCDGVGMNIDLYICTTSTCTYSQLLYTPASCEVSVLVILTKTIWKIQRK